MTPGMVLRLALAVPETPENWRALRELIQALQNMVNQEEAENE